MHIPDGYLSPATCGALYAAATPFWYAALRRVQAVLHTRAVPRLALVAAFAFVIMMFNLPLPGGTSGHAAGLGLSAALLGPWASIVSMSVALAIQALFFGDGGITAFGANAFNMAIVGSLVAWSVYSAVAGGAAPASRRHAIAAGIAGYAAINAAALCAAIEFGIQPMIYRDAAGAPLYAPYPLSVAVPAMMIGHLTIAGFAEAFVSGGVVAFAQRADLTLLTRRGGGPAPWTGLKPLGALLATLLVLTPLGLLTAGTAWGEWTPQELRSPAGMVRLSDTWRAPMAGYAPSWMGASAGYVLSGAVGVASILALAGAVAWRVRR